MEFIVRCEKPSDSRQLLTLLLEKTIRPATIVATGAPRKARPSKGVLRDLLGESAAR